MLWILARMSRLQIFSLPPCRVGKFMLRGQSGVCVSPLWGSIKLWPPAKISRKKWVTIMIKIYNLSSLGRGHCRRTNYTIITRSGEIRILITVSSSSVRPHGGLTSHPVWRFVSCCLKGKRSINYPHKAFLSLRKYELWEICCLNGVRWMGVKF